MDSYWECHIAPPASHPLLFPSSIYSSSFSIAFENNRNPMNSFIHLARLLRWEHPKKSHQKISKWSLNNVQKKKIGRFPKYCCRRLGVVNGRNQRFGPANGAPSLVAAPFEFMPPIRPCQGRRQHTHQMSQSQINWQKSVSLFNRIYKEKWRHTVPRTPKHIVKNLSTDLNKQHG